MAIAKRPCGDIIVLVAPWYGGSGKTSREALAHCRELGRWFR